MTTNKLAYLLDQIQILVSQCQEIVGSKPPITFKSQRHTRPNKQAKEGLPERILRLRSSGFFSQAKTGREVQVKLKPTYDCEPDRVLMALLRLMKRKQLRKASKTLDDKKQVAYVW